jgi:type II secretory pathway pseudopilin PulG
MRNKPSGNQRGRSRKGYTLIEAVVTCMLASLLALLLARGWATFARPAAEVEARARLEQEAILAAEALARDLGGYMPATFSTGNDLGRGQFVGWEWPGGTVLRLCFDGDPPNGNADWQAPDHVIKYEFVVDDPGQGIGRLVRSDEGANTSSTVARLASSLSVAPSPAGAQPVNQLAISLKLSYRDFTGIYTLTAIKPP